MDPYEIVQECFSKYGAPDRDYWPDVERWITETIDGMWIDIPGVDPFGPSEQREELLSESLALAAQEFEEKNYQRWESEENEFD